MKLYAHEHHAYGQPGRPNFMEWAQGQVREVPDNIGVILLEVVPDKFCDVTNEVDASEHICTKTLENIDKAQYETEQLLPTNIAPLSGTGRVSKQRLDIRRNTYARSRVARANRAASTRSA